MYLPTLQKKKKKTIILSMNKKLLRIHSQLSHSTIVYESLALNLSSYSINQNKNFIYSFIPSFKTKFISKFEKFT